MGVDWPDEFDLTPADDREGTYKFKTDFQQTQKELRREMTRMDVDDWSLDRDTSGDFPGVVLRWRKDDVDYAVACDFYKRKRSNLRALYLWVNETRMRNERPIKSGEDEFAAARLPAGTEEVTQDPPHEVLEVAPDASPVVVKASFNEKVKRAHGDTDHDSDGEYSVSDLQRARDALLDQ